MDQYQKPKIDSVLVDRVAECLAMGIPLNIALAGEGVTRAEYKEQLARDPELQSRQDVAKKNFLKNSINMLLEGENRGANIRWLLELVYPDTFANPDGNAESPKTKPTILGLSEEEVRLLRENASKR